MGRTYWYGQSSPDSPGSRGTKPTLPIARLLERQYDLSIFDYNYGDPDILYLYFDSSQEKGGLNYTFYKSTVLDRYIETGRASFNLKVADKAYVQAQRFMDARTLIDPLRTDELVTAVRKTVKGWHTDASGAPLYQDLYVTGAR